MHKIFTVGDAMRKRHQAKAAFDAKCDLMIEKAASQKKIIDDFLHANPQVGILMRGGRPMYYINLPNGKIKESRDPQTLISLN